MSASAGGGARSWAAGPLGESRPRSALGWAATRGRGGPKPAGCCGLLFFFFLFFSISNSYSFLNKKQPNSNEDLNPNTQKNDAPA
jgi:hypothetical protein